MRLHVFGKKAAVGNRNAHHGIQPGGSQTAAVDNGFIRNTLALQAERHIGKVGFIPRQGGAPFGGQPVDFVEAAEAAVAAHHGDFQVGRRILLLHKFTDRPDHWRSDNRRMAGCLHHFGTQLLSVLLCCPLAGNRLIQVVLGAGGTMDLHCHGSKTTALFRQIARRHQPLLLTDRATERLISVSCFFDG